MSEGIQYDEAWGQRLVQIYSTPDVVKQREIVLSALNIQPDERVRYLFLVAKPETS